MTCLQPPSALPVFLAKTIDHECLQFSCQRGLIPHTDWGRDKPLRLCMRIQPCLRTPPRRTRAPPSWSYVCSQLSPCGMRSILHCQRQGLPLLVICSRYGCRSRIPYRSKQRVDDSPGHRAVRGKLWASGSCGLYPLGSRKPTMERACSQVELYGQDFRYQQSERTTGISYHCGYGRGNSVGGKLVRNARG